MKINLWFYCSKSVAWLFWCIDYHLNNHMFYYKYHDKTMVSVANPWLICGYHGLTIETMFFGFICSKTMADFHKVYHSLW